MSTLGDLVKGQTIDTECTNCKGQIQIPAELFIDAGTFVCPHCNMEYRCDGSGGKEAEKAIEGLKQTIRDINKHHR